MVLDSIGSSGKSILDWLDVDLDRLILSIFPELSTHRVPIPHDSPQSYFANEGLLATISIVFCRYTVTFNGETHLERLLYAGILGYLTWMREEYWLIAAVQLSSHFITYTLRKLLPSLPSKTNNNKEQEGGAGKKTITSFILDLLIYMATFCLGTIVIFYLIYNCANKNGFTESMYSTMVPSPEVRQQIYEMICYLIPVEEVKEAYTTIAAFVNPQTLNSQVSHLFFITLQIQVGMGYLGIGFLRTEQIRKNSLITLESKVDNNNKKKAKKLKKRKGVNGSHHSSDEEDLSKEFRRSAVSFIFLAAVPYMAQIIFFGGMNMYAFHCFRDDVHRTIRLNGLFDNDGSRFINTAQNSTALSPSAYAGEIDKVVTTTYDMFNRKFFSLPKILLLPSVLTRQPLLLLKIFPFILLTDLTKARVVATITSEIERLEMKKRDITSIRTQVEQFDLKNSDLVQRSGRGAIEFTERRWTDLTEEIQDISVRTSIMQRSRGFFSWLQRNFVMMALVDCALAKLIAIGKIVSADIFVFQRAIEDTIDLLLMKSRAESELATMQSSIVKLNALKEIWSTSEERRLLPCHVDEDKNDNLSISGLAYTRGTCSVKVDHISLKPGIYAVTGANGTGKSTLFRVLMGCSSNIKSIDIHKSIDIISEGDITMPSSNVVEISQNFYWPLHTKPIDWIFQKHLDIDVDKDERDRLVSKVDEELQSLQFRKAQGSVEGSENSLKDELLEEKEDWFGDLSGGQKSKVELIRKVFLSDTCPKILLIDETFAPLDPESKSLVMTKLKQFCSESVVMVIYHADVKADELGNQNEKIEDTCVPSSNFFDDNLHIENGTFSLRAVCVENP